VRRRQVVPNYYLLYISARSFIQRQINDGASIIEKSYKGPSRNELEPITLNFAGYQDPQMIFNKWYFCPTEEKFLFQFVVATDRYPEALPTSS
jgi:hypothetical protein